jgi:hypothetical protein
VNATDFAAYNAFTGVGSVGQGGYVGYAGDFGSGNVTNLISTSAGVAAGTNTLVAGGTVTAMLRIGGAFQNDVAFTNANDVLNLELGGNGGINAIVNDTNFVGAQSVSGNATAVASVNAIGLDGGDMHIAGNASIMSTVGVDSKSESHTIA